MQTDRREAVEDCSSSQEHESDSSGGSGDSGGIFGLSFSKSLFLGKDQNNRDPALWL